MPELRALLSLGVSQNSVTFQRRDLVVFRGTAAETPYDTGSTTELFVECTGMATCTRAHNTMRPDHEWIASLVRHHRKQLRVAAMNPLPQPGRSPRPATRKMRARKEVVRKLTPSSCDSSHSRTWSDVPFEVRVCDETDSMSDLSQEEVDDSVLSKHDGAGDCVGECVGEGAGERAGDIIGWGIATLSLDDQCWPSDEGSPQKKKKGWRTLDGIPVEVRPLDDERQDYGSKRK